MEAVDNKSMKYGVLLLRVYSSWHSRSPPGQSTGAVHSLPLVTVQTLSTFHLYEETISVGHDQDLNRTKGHSSLSCATSEKITWPENLAQTLPALWSETSWLHVPVQGVQRVKRAIKYSALLWAPIFGHVWIPTQATRDGSGPELICSCFSKCIIFFTIDLMLLIYIIIKNYVFSLYF